MGSSLKSSAQHAVSVKSYRNYRVFYNAVTAGLHTWKDQSTVAYAVSNDPLGPFEKQSTVLTREAHNPQAMLFNNSWYIFHIGYRGAPPLKSCNESMPSRPMVDKGEESLAKEPPPWPGAGQIHKSSSPEGPYKPVKLPTGWKACNNPSPFVTANGTVYCMCAWRIMHADRPEGPWHTPTMHVNGEPVKGRIFAGGFCAYANHIFPAHTVAFSYQAGAGRIRSFGRTSEGTGTSSHTLTHLTSIQPTPLQVPLCPLPPPPAPPPPHTVATIGSSASS
jgi:hypothetical protein